MKFKIAAASLALALAASTHAFAGEYRYMGDTTGAPTMNRPITATVLSSTGTEVRFDALTFSVDLSGVYSFLSESPLYDNYTMLYRDSFAPAAPLDNVVAINDDVPSTFGVSGFLSYLSAGTPYVFVNTGFTNEDYGSFAARIDAEGNILVGQVTPPVPEPETYAMLLGGLALLAGWQKRHKKFG
jgi:hypothetical protein